jgi:hypothetical protein
MNKPLTESLQSIFEGFRKLPAPDKQEYLKYLASLIEKQENPTEKNLLIGFKAKLEEERT